MNMHDEDGCRKAFFLEGWINTFACEVKKQFLQQEEYIHQLEERIKQLEDVIATKTK